MNRASQTVHQTNGVILGGIGKSHRIMGGMSDKKTATELIREIKALLGDVGSGLRITLAKAAKVGQALLDLKAQTPRNRWGKRRAATGLKERSAQVYMQVARHPQLPAALKKNLTLEG